MGKGGRQADGQRCSRRQCGAVEALPSQHGARRPAAQAGTGAPSFMAPLSPPTPPSPLPVCFLSPLSFFFFFLPAPFHPTSIRAGAASLDSGCTQLFLSPQRDSSWLLPRRKFSHVFLIKAPHRRPVRSPLVQRSKCRVFLPAIKNTATLARRGNGAQRMLTHYPVRAVCPPPHRSCGHVSPPTSDSRDEFM